MVDISSIQPQNTPSIVYLEIRPCTWEGVEEEGRDETAPSFLAAAVKVHLMDWTCRALLDPSTKHLRIHFESKVPDGHMIRQGIIHMDDDENQDRKSVWLPQLNPCLPEQWPCHCTGFVATSNSDTAIPQEPSYIALITEKTIVRIFPRDSNTDRARLTGELPIQHSPANNDILVNHDEQTIRDLTIQLHRLVKDPIMIGIGAAPTGIATSSRLCRREVVPQVMQLERDGALLVHSPEHGAGKSSLIEYLVKSRFGCEEVHIINFGPLFSKYGLSTAVALETILYQAVLSAAMRGKPICIILDHLPSMMPPSYFGMSGAGDASITVLGGIASYLRVLTHELHHHKRFPFPDKNPLYHFHSSRCFQLPVKLFLVAVATCPDDSWKRNAQSNRSNVVTDAFRAAPYRLPSLSAKQRRRAFEHALQRHHMEISSELQEVLPSIAAAAVWARGSIFEKVARLARNPGGNEPISKKSFIETLHKVFRSYSLSTAVQVSANLAKRGEMETFSSVGGNIDAKLALEEAVAVDDEKRRLLLTFGMSLPKGVLLFGPPGTGKTLLARSISQMLKKANPSGGAFISINSTDVARAEIGTGEKLLKEAFETASLNAPAVVFIDEFQALFADRSSGGSSRLTSTLLTLMDDSSSWAELAQTKRNSKSNDSNRIVVLAATNTPWMVDKAFLRTGRFDRVVHVGLPSEEERIAILKILISRMHTTLAENELDGFCHEIAARSQGYSGADLASFCRNAAVLSLLGGSNQVEAEHFRQALDDSGPSSDEHLVERIKKWRPL